MDTNLGDGERQVGEHVLLADEVYKIVGCAFDVLNEMGHGGKEKIYENALTVEFGLRGIPFEQQKQFPAVYKGTKVGTLIPDLICFDLVIVETKAIPEIGNYELGQVLNYLKITGLQVGLILNFSKPKLEWERVVL